jgi:hypothetical protein
LSAARNTDSKILSGLIVDFLTGVGSDDPVDICDDLSFCDARRFVARINSRAQSAPRSDIYVRRTAACAVLLDQPFTGAGQFQPRAVHQQMHGFGVGRRSRHL